MEGWLWLLAFGILALAFGLWYFGFRSLVFGCCYFGFCCLGFGCRYLVFVVLALAALARATAGGRRIALSQHALVGQAGEFKQQGGPPTTLGTGSTGLVAKPPGLTGGQQFGGQCRPGLRSEAWRGQLPGGAGPTGPREWRKTRRGDSDPHGFRPSTGPGHQGDAWGHSGHGRCGVHGEIAIRKC